MMVLISEMLGRDKERRGNGQWVVSDRSSFLSIEDRSRSVL